MRHKLAVGFLLSLLPTSSVADDARAVIKRGIAAQGGPAAVEARVAGERTRSKGTVVIDLSGAGTPTEHAYTSDSYAEAGGRERNTMKLTRGGGRVEMTTVFDGKKAWSKFDEFVKEEDAAKTVENSYYERVGLLHGLLEDKAFGFAALGESKVRDKPVLGVRVSRKGHADTLLYFDKVTGLLVKATFPYIEKDGKKETHELYLSAYRKVDFGIAEERLLKEYGVATTNKDLLDLVRNRTPSADSAKKVADLVRELGDDEFGVRERASKGLIALGSIAVPALQAARRNTDREISTRASECLLRIKPDRQERALIAAVRLLGVRQVDGACGPLLALLPGANETLSREVSHALLHLAVKVGKPDAVLVAALKDKDTARRIAAERALGKDGGKFALQAGRPLYPRGLEYPMKKSLYVDGKKFAEEEITEVNFFNRFDDALFNQP